MMKYLFLSLIFLFNYCPIFGQSTDSKIQLDIVKQINPERMIYDIRDFASPAFEGRELGTLGNTKASDWIKYQFNQIGLSQLPGFDAFEQSFPVRNFKIGSSNSLAFSDIVFESPIVSPAVWGISSSTNGLIVNPSENLSGKIVLAPIDSTDSFSSSTFEKLYHLSKIYQAKGAIGIIFYWNTDYNDGVNLYRFDDFVEIPLLAEKNITNSSRPYLNVESIPIPILFTTKSIGEQLTLNINSKVSISTDFSIEFEKTAKNILGYIPGKIDRLDKALIVYATLDQDGVNSTNGTPYLGANSNGSGIITLLELSKAVFALKSQPIYPIIFVALNGSKRLDCGFNELLNSDFYKNNLGSNLWIELNSTGYTFTEEDLTHINITVNSPLSFYKNIPFGITKRPKIEATIDTSITNFHRNQIRHHITFTSDISPYTNRVIDAQNKLNFVTMYRIAEVTSDLIWRLANNE